MQSKQKYRRQQGLFEDLEKNPRFTKHIQKKKPGGISLAKQPYIGQIPHSSHKTPSAWFCSLNVSTLCGNSLLHMYLFIEDSSLLFQKGNQLLKDLFFLFLIQLFWPFFQGNWEKHIIVIPKYKQYFPERTVISFKPHWCQSDGMCVVKSLHKYQCDFIMSDAS